MSMVRRPSIETTITFRNPMNIELKHCRYPRIIPVLIHYHRASLSTMSFCRLARLSDLSLRRVFVETFDLGEGTIGLGGFAFGLGLDGSPEGPHDISCPQGLPAIFCDVYDLGDKC